MKTLNGRIKFFIIIFIVLCISCEKNIDIKSFWGEYEFSYFEAFYKIDDNRLSSFTDSIFKTLSMTEDYCSIGFYNNINPNYEVVYPNVDGVVDIGLRSYTCSFFVGLLTENRIYKQVILIDNCIVVEIINENEIAINAEGGWFVYKKR